MKKLRLELEALDVVSFATNGEHGVPRGTVHGQVVVSGYESYEAACGFTLGWHDSCYGVCRTNEYWTCQQAGPTVGPSCDYHCTAPSVGCTPPAETEYCA